MSVIKTTNVVVTQNSIRDCDLFCLMFAYVIQHHTQYKLAELNFFFYRWPVKNTMKKMAMLLSVDFAWQ